MTIRTLLRRIAITTAQLATGAVVFMLGVTLLSLVHPTSGLPAASSASACGAMAFNRCAKLDTSNVTDSRPARGDVELYADDAS